MIITVFLMKLIIYLYNSFSITWLSYWASDLKTVIKWKWQKNYGKITQSVNAAIFSFFFEIQSNFTSSVFSLILLILLILGGAGIFQKIYKVN
jgi:hypothetical protein